MKQGVKQGWEVICVQCLKKKWPYLAENPVHYVCVLCRGGISTGRQAAGRKGAAVKAAIKKARREQQAS